MIIGVPGIGKTREIVRITLILALQGNAVSAVLNLKSFLLTVLAS